MSERNDELPDLPTLLAGPWPGVRRCENCRFFDPAPTEVGGTCLRYPPVDTPEGFCCPHVPSSWVCGEWNVRKGKVL